MSTSSHHVHQESYMSGFYARVKWSRAYGFVPSVCLSVVNFNFHYNFWTARYRGFIFGMHTLLLMPFSSDLDFDLYAKNSFFGFWCRRGHNISQLVFPIPLQCIVILWLQNKEFKVHQLSMACWEFCQTVGSYFLSLVLSVSILALNNNM